MSITELVKVQPRRPILTHLNADTSWLISFPVPPPHNYHRAYYHVLLDPWLDGDIVEGYRWFFVLMHSIKAKYSTIKDVQNLILETESTTNPHNPTDKGNPDIVVVSHYLRDHCHRETLLTIDPEVPILSVDTAFQDIKKWNPFKTQETMPDLDVSDLGKLWHCEKPSLLPNWLRIVRIPSGERFPELRYATLFAFDASGVFEQPETIMYTPHGIYADRLLHLGSTGRMLAVLHGLNSSYYPVQANLGVQNVYQVAVRTKSKYWIPTHDENLTYLGINAWFQSKLKAAFSDIIHGAESGNEEDHYLICRELGNGESFLLE